MSGTKLAYALTPCYAISGTDLTYGATLVYTSRGTELAYAAMGLQADQAQVSPLSSYATLLRYPPTTLSSYPPTPHARPYHPTLSSYLMFLR
eukprot:3940237-Rhodomonas_salina.3